MPDDQKPFHLSLNTPTTPSGDAPQAPHPVIQDTTLPQTNVAPTPIPETLAPAPTPSPQPATPTTEPTPPVIQPIRPPVMPTQGAASRTQRTVAPPIAPHVVIHTMESDIQDAKKEPQQQTDTAPTQETQKPITPPQTLTKNSIPKFLVGIVLFSITIGMVGYFGYGTIAPLFMSKTTLPIPEQSEKTTQSQSTEETIPSAPNEQQTTHTSFLVKPADKTISSNIKSLSFQEIKNIFASLTKENAGALEEIVPSLNTTNIALKDFGALFLVSFPFSLFENDFTLLAYHDTTNISPVIIFKLKPNTENQNIALIKTDIQRIIEQDSQTSITQLFIEDPGIPTSNFINGGVPNSTAEIRYRTFENNSVFDYGWLGDKLIFTTSYAALKETVARLQ